MHPLTAAAALLMAVVIPQAQTRRVDCTRLGCVLDVVDDARVGKASVVAASGVELVGSVSRSRDVPHSSAESDSSSSVAGIEWKVVPSAGAGVVLIRRRRDRSTLNRQVEVKLRLGGWRLAPFASARETGILCGDGCTHAWAAGVGAERLMGWVWLGVGAGGLKQSGDWHFQPHVAISVEGRHLQLQVRAEKACGMRGLYMPVLIGLRLP